MRLNKAVVRAGIRAFVKILKWAFTFDFVGHLTPTPSHKGRGRVSPTDTLSGRVVLTLRPQRLPRFCFLKQVAVPAPVKPLASARRRDHLRGLAATCAGDGVRCAGTGFFFRLPRVALDAELSAAFGGFDRALAEPAQLKRLSCSVGIE